MSPKVRCSLVVLFSIFLAGCASAAESEDSEVSVSTAAATVPEDDESTTTATPGETTDATPSTSEFPDILAARATQADDGSWRFDVTVSSPYDTPERYADAWRVVGPDGSEYGIRVLTHDHASEQPFTRSQNGIQIPDGVATVTIEGRDLVNGWGGGTLALDLPAP